MITKHSIFHYYDRQCFLIVELKIKGKSPLVLTLCGKAKVKSIKVIQASIMTVKPVIWLTNYTLTCRWYDYYC